MEPIKQVIKDLEAVLAALAKSPPADKATLSALLQKAQDDLAQAKKTIVGGDGDSRTPPPPPPPPAG